MAKYDKGTVVINVNTKERGVVIDVLPLRRGRQFYDVMIGSEKPSSLKIA